MTAKITTTALILAAFTLIGGAVIPTEVLVPATTPFAAYAQLSGVGNIVGDTLGEDDSVDLGGPNISIPVTAIPIINTEKEVVVEEEEEEAAPPPEEPPEEGVTGEEIIACLLLAPGEIRDCLEELIEEE